MAYQRLDRDRLSDKVIDVHSHAGVSLKAYACGEYPYAETVEGLRYRQRVGNVVAVNVVFPIGADLFFDPAELVAGRCSPARQPLSVAPFATENRMLLREVYELAPENPGHFLPFAAIDPGRQVEAQLETLRDLSEKFPIYGMKVNPVMVQTPVTELARGGRRFLELAQENNWPIMLHSTQHRQEQYSRADLAFQVIRQFPQLRFCLAHCIGFHREYLQKADELPNVWVDTAALTIQVQLVREDSEVIASPADRVDADYSDCTKVMQALVQQFPGTICWGSDSPFYSFFSRRAQSDGVYAEFRLKADYEDELRALTNLPEPLRETVASANTLDFLFGRAE